MAAPGPHTVVIAFANDAYGGTATTDRNLYLDGVAGVAEIVPPRTFMSPSGVTLTVTVPEDAPAIVARLVTALTIATALSQRLQTLMATTARNDPMPVLTGPGGVLDPGHATIIPPVITVTPAAPTFAVNATGTFATLSAVPAGTTRTIIGDGRVVLGAGGITLAVGMIAATAGTSIPVTITDAKTGVPSVTLVLFIPVTAAQVVTALPPITVTPAAPTFAIGTSSVFATLSAVPAEATRTIIGDGRVVLGSGDVTLVVGLTASIAGTNVPVTIADAKVGTPNVTLTLSIPVTAATAATIGTMLATFAGAAGSAPVGVVAGTGTGPVPALDGAGHLPLPANSPNVWLPALAPDGIYTVTLAAPSVLSFLIRNTATSTAASGYWTRDATISKVTNGADAGPVAVGSNAGASSIWTVSINGSVLTLANANGQTTTATDSSYLADGYLAFRTQAQSALVVSVFYQTLAQADAAYVAAHPAGMTITGVG